MRKSPPSLESANYTDIMINWAPITFYWNESTLMSSLTVDLGKFVASWRESPTAATTISNQGIVDAVGVMLAARQQPVVASLRRTLGVAEHGESTVLLESERMRADDAALVNATAAHAFAMDDVAVGCHPSAVLLPALLAEAEVLGASGKALLNAYVVGFEVLAEIAAREPDALHRAGWHPTGQIGPIAVAAAVANLRGLSAAEASHAMGIASSMGGGIMGNFGTPTKALHAGRVAQAGVFAARLAAAGITASSDALENPTGLLKVLSPQGRVDVERPYQTASAETLHLLQLGLSIKQYPVCYSTHRVVDAAREIREMPGFDPAQVERVAVHIGTRQAWMARHEQPTTELEARYSVEFAAAAGLLAGNAGFAQLQPDFLHSPALQQLIARVTRELDSRENPEDPIASPSDRVEVWLKDGTHLVSQDVPYAAGHAKRPLDADALRQKFLDCVLAGGRDDGPELFERWHDLSVVNDMRELTH